MIVYVNRHIHIFTIKGGETMKVKNIFLSVAIGLLFGVLSLSSSVAAEDRNVPAGGNTREVQILINEDLGIIIETVEATDDGTPLAHIETDYSKVFDTIQSDPDRQASRTFTHNIYDRNGKLLAKVTSTVRETYSQADSWAIITGITPSASGPFAHDFSFGTSMSGSEGYLDIYFSGLPAGTMHYKIYSNGTILNK